MKVIIFCFTVLVAGCMAAAGPRGELPDDVQTKPLFPTKGMLKGSRETPQSLTCWDNFNEQGSSYHFGTNTIFDDFSKINFDNRAKSCCYDGIWILYEDRAYNKYNSNGKVHWAYGKNFCENLDNQLSNTVSSARYVGAPNGYEYNTLELFSGQYFTGDNQWFYSDNSSFPNFDNKANSVIVTGKQAWTVYEYNNYQGRCKCMYPQDSNLAKPGFYKTMSDLANIQISSVKGGCQSGCQGIQLKSSDEEAQSGSYLGGEQ